MPFDPAGNASLPPSTWATAGQTIRTEQHNPPFRDIEQMLSNVLKRDGRDGMVGPLNMGGFPIRGAQDGTAASDGATVGQVAGIYGEKVNEAPGKSTPVDADYLPIYDSAASNALKNLSWANLKATLKAYFDAIYDRTPVGTVIWVAANTAPTGYLKCNGAAVSRTTYADLFARIGTTFGTGNGSTTFNLPDLRGEFIRGWTDGRGVDSGRVFGSAQADEFKLHGHPFRIDPTSGQASGPNGGFQLRVSGQTMPAYTGAPSNTNGQQIGGSGGSETRPRNVALLACIKT